MQHLPPRFSRVWGQTPAPGWPRASSACPAPGPGSAVPAVSQLRARPTARPRGNCNYLLMVFQSPSPPGGCHRSSLLVLPHRPASPSVSAKPIPSGAVGCLGLEKSDISHPEREKGRKLFPLPPLHIAELLWPRGDPSPGQGGFACRDEPFCAQNQPPWSQKEFPPAVPAEPRVPVSPAPLCAPQEQGTGWDTWNC